MIRAVYPGSFDPITNGHIYISERAAALFDELIVAVLVNLEKRSTFSEEERQIMAREALVHLPNVKVKYFNGLLVDFMRQQQSRIIIRGLRALSDFEYEFQLAQMNRQLAPEIEHQSRFPVRRRRPRHGPPRRLPPPPRTHPAAGDVEKTAKTAPLVHRAQGRLLFLFPLIYYLKSVIRRQRHRSKFTQHFEIAGNYLVRAHANLRAVIRQQLPFILVLV